MPPTVDAVHAALEPRLERLRSLQDIPPTWIPDTVNRDAGYTFWGVTETGYFYRADERGRQVFRHETEDVDELVYWICRDVVRQLAGRARSRSLPFRRRDPRRARFAREAQLLGAVDPAWGARCRAEREELLVRYPYRDGRR